VTHRFAWLAVAAALALPAAAGAQVFGQFTPAPTLAQNGHMAGGYLTSSSNTVGLTGQLRLSFYPGVDFGFQGGFARQTYIGGNLTTLRLGGDLKYQVTHASVDRPYDISIDGALGVESGDRWNIVSVCPSVVASRTFSGNLTPYASAGIQFANINVRSFNQSDVSLPIKAGAELKISSQLALSAELQLRLSDDFSDDVGFAVGVNSPF